MAGTFAKSRVTQLLSKFKVPSLSGNAHEEKKRDVNFSLLKCPASEPYLGWSWSGSISATNNLPTTLGLGSSISNTFNQGKTYCRLNLNCPQIKKQKGKSYLQTLCF